MNPERRRKKVEQDHEILARQAAVRATVALKMGIARPQGLRMLGSGTHEDLHHMSVVSTLRRERAVSLRLATACAWPRAVSTTLECGRTGFRSFSQRMPQMVALQGSTLPHMPSMDLNAWLCDLQAVAVKVFVTEMGAF